MNSKVIAVVVGLVLLLGAGGIFLYSKNSPSTNTSSTNPEPTKAQQSSAQSSLADLLLGGKNQTCTFSSKVTEGTSTEGTVYLSGTKMRGDITNTSKDGKVSMFYMIRDGDTTYIWGSSLPTGIKMTLSADDLKNNTGDASKYAGTFSSVKSDYKCSGWSVDSSKFTVPTNVKFTDVSSMMMHESPTGTSGYQPGAGYSCAGITDPTAKAACEASLNH